MTCASFHTIVGELGVKATLVALCLSVTCTDCWSELGVIQAPLCPQVDHASLTDCRFLHSRTRFRRCTRFTVASCSLSYALGTPQHSTVQAMCTRPARNLVPVPLHPILIGIHHDHSGAAAECRAAPRSKYTYGQRTVAAASGFDSSLCAAA